jgi:hypothetical protein
MTGPAQRACPVPVSQGPLANRDEKEYVPDDLDASAPTIDNGAQEGEEEEEEEEHAAQGTVTFAVVNGEINVDVPLGCAGKKRCTVLHSNPFPVLPDVHTQGFPQPGMVAILMHCKGDWAKFNQHRHLAKHAEQNTKHFDIIHHRVNNDKNVRSGKICTTQATEELLAEYQEHVQDAPPQIVLAFEDVIRV